MSDYTPEILYSWDTHQETYGKLQRLYMALEKSLPKTQELKFKKLHPSVHLSERHYAGAGWDIRAFRLDHRGAPSTFLLPTRSTVNIPTGLVIEPPPGHFVMVCSRSGLASNSVWVTNAPGIIDPDYRGEIKVLLYNGSSEPQWVKHDDRIAQLIVMPLSVVSLVEVQELSQTERGEAGFGSTGT